ncbi:MAG: orotidine-5'-phosphate decarboxylase [Gammaproteobacteria bacterium]|nr:orotidine-5'-phosphate decarboxylase [Gammaproteobacteria bacterium]
MQNTNDPRVIVALDYPSAAAALALVERLDPARCRVKVGKELFTRAGPDLVRRLVDAGFDVFLDLKYHDIPNTVAGACAAAADLGVWMVNVHALGGRAMMEAAREALEGGGRRPLLIAVTVLTSHSEADLADIGLAGTPMENVRRLAALAGGSGLDGVVCSPREVTMLRESHGDGFRLVTPGIRPSGAALGDQKRVMTPGDAIRSGSDYLVIGRPITGADDPMGVLLAVEAEIDAVLAG